MRTKPTLKRRQFLRGMGVTLALPTLPSTGRANETAETSPRRLVCIGNHLGYYHGNFFPGDESLNSPTLQPLRPHWDDITVFSHLDHRLNGGHGGVHGFLSGIKKEEAAGFPDKNITVDQMAAEYVGSATRYSSLTTGIDKGTHLCWTRAGVSIPPINNPAKLFQALFVESDRKGREVERKRLMHRSSVLDALRESAGALNKTLNQTDRDKLDQYLTSVREIEQRLQMSQEWLDRPKPRATIEEVVDEERLHIDEIALFYDLIALALETDSTRVATFEIPMGFQTAELQLESYHALSHHGKTPGRIEQLAVVESFLTSKLNGFLTALKNKGLFDDTLVVFGSGMGDGSKHSNRDLPVMLAGGGLEHRGHLICPQEDHRRIPLCNLFLSALHWFGMEELEHFGRSTGTFAPMEIA